MSRNSICQFVIVVLLGLCGCQRHAQDASSDQNPRIDGAQPATKAPADLRPETSAAVADKGGQALSKDSSDVLPVTAGMPQTADELKLIRAEHNREVWSEEVLAQEYERTFVDLWDKLIHRADKFNVLKEFEFGELMLATQPTSETLDWQIERVRFDGPLHRIAAEEWPDWVAKFESDGYRIAETEFHHSAFQPSPEGATSQVSFVIHAERNATNERFIVRGNLHIKWQADVNPRSGRFVPATIDASDIYVLSRKGQPAFKEARIDRFPIDLFGKKSPTTIHPLILQDLNDDGLPEIVVGGFNHVYVNRGNWQFDFRRLCEFPAPHVNAGAFADFDGDGIRDYLAAMKNGLPVLYHGARGGMFPDQPRVLRIATEPLRVPINVVPGDVDGDGDLDVFIGQQKPGYSNGDIPTPYFDARDSFPCFLLLNDGQGNFTDVTSHSGLGDKHRRRNFAASLIDYDEDNDLDLIMTSDFSGTDLFQNDGRGNFTDVTETLEPQAHAFGMSHTFGDYDLDRTIDFLTVGMSSTTARRLEQMQLGRAEYPAFNEARMKMGYGNRLFLFQNGRYTQAPFNNDVARTGWSWGSTTLDFDNDADPDIYVVNGQTSGQTTKDYCTSFWCHDVYYKRGERPDAALRELFNEMAPLFSGNDISWNGYEHNALLMNLGGHGFINVGFLMNVSFEFDSRAALSGDIDGDGRVDLIVEHKDLRASESKLYIVRNVWDQPAHWIGVHLRQSAGQASPFGARVTATLADGRVLLQHNVAGHSVWVQHANTIHFGLGDAQHVASLEVHWPDGTTQRIAEPAIDQYHVFTSGGGLVSDE